jgi:hypothetical protein
MMQTRNGWFEKPYNGGDSSALAYGERGERKTKTERGRRDHV